MVGVHVHFIPRLGLAGAEHAVFFQQRNGLLVLQHGQGFRRLGQVGQAAFGGFDFPLGGVIVAVEEDALVLADDALQHTLQYGVQVLLAGGHLGFDLAADLVHGPGGNSVEHDIRAGATLAGANGAKLELVAGKGHGRRAVAVGRIARQTRQCGHANLDMTGGLGAFRAALFDLLDDVRELLAQEDRDDGGRRFVGAEAVVIAGGGHGHAQQRGVGVHGLHDHAQHGEKLGVLVRRMAGREPVLAVRSDERPVVVLAGSVDAGKGLLVQQADEAEALGDFLEHMHGDHIVVHGEVLFLEDRGDLELRGADFVVLRAGRHTELPQLAVHLVHERHDAGLDVPEVMVFHLLVAGRTAAEERATGLQQVQAFLEVLAIDQEVFLFRAQRGKGARDSLDAEQFPHARELGGQRVLRAEEPGFLVQCVAMPAAEDGRNEEHAAALGVFTHKRGAGGVPGRVAAGLERGAQAARREAGGVRFALDQFLAGEGRHRAAFAVWREERLMLLGRDAGQRLEQVGEMRGAFFQRPRLHGIRDLVRDGMVQRLALDDRRNEFLVGVFGEVISHRLQAEDILAELAEF